MVTVYIGPMVSSNILEGSTPLPDHNEVVDLGDSCTARGPPGELMDTFVWEDDTINETDII